MSDRKKVAIGIRVVPCEFCGHPLTHRHHLLPVADWGENNLVIQICPNCHDIYHIIEKSILHTAKYGNKKGRCNRLFGHLIATWGENDNRISRLTEVVLLALVKRQYDIPEKYADPALREYLEQSGAVDIYLKQLKTYDDKADES